MSFNSSLGNAAGSAPDIGHFPDSAFILGFPGTVGNGKGQNLRNNTGKNH
jgi:hypothetical protein